MFPKWFVFSGDDIQTLYTLRHSLTSCILPVSSSFTTSRELLSQFSTCSGRRWLEELVSFICIHCCWNSHLKVNGNVPILYLPKLNMYNIWIWRPDSPYSDGSYQFTFNKSITSRNKFQNFLVVIRWWFIPFLTCIISEIQRRSSLLWWFI